MQKFILLLIISFSTYTAAHSQVVKPEEAKDFVGKTITVCGEIFSGKYLENAKTTPTLLNMGDKFPNQPLTIVIPSNVRRQFGYKPEEVLVGKNICVSGTVTKYQKTVQIVIDDKSKVRIL